MNNICIWCNKSFYRNKTVKFCSRECNLEHWEKNNKQRRLQLKRENNFRRRERGVHAFFIIKDRCNNCKNTGYKYYGGKGIKCLFLKEEFLKIYWRTNNCEQCNKILGKLATKHNPDMRTIDRIDSNKNYEESNVRIVCLSCNVKNSHGNRVINTDICIICGGEIKTKFNGNQFGKSKYCSKKCFNANRRNKRNNHIKEELKI